MKHQEDKKELNVGVLIDDDIIKDQCEKQDRNPDKGYEDCLGKFTKPGFSENFTVGSDQRIKHQPEKRDDGNAVIKFPVEKNVIEMSENLVIYRVFPVNKEQRPGDKSRQKICGNIFNNL